MRQGWAVEFPAPIGDKARSARRGREEPNTDARCFFDRAARTDGSGAGTAGVLMALAHAILATVLHAPMTGYDLARKFDRRSGYIWRATHQQIYQELAKLERRGMLEPVREGVALRADRVPRSITEAGREHLLEWVIRSDEPASIKDEILVKCMALGLASAEQVAGPIAERRAQHEERLAHYRSVVDRHYPNPRALHGEALGNYLALAGGMRYESAWIGWADEALALLGEG